MDLNEDDGNPAMKLNQVIECSRAVSSIGRDGAVAKRASIYVYKV